MKARHLLALVLALPALALAQENMGKVQQGLVGGTIVPPDRQEEFTLLTLTNNSGTCSASLLRNGWAITAAHCVEDDNGDTVPPATVTLTANWRTMQTRQAVRIETFRPYDIAVVQLDEPFSVRGRTTGFGVLPFVDGQFPYFGEPVGASMIAFGRGIYEFAQGDTPAKRDGQFRLGYVQPTRNDGTQYWFPSDRGQMIAGGDSGGPSFAWVLGGYALVGVHSQAKTVRVPDKPKKGWDWVSATPEAADAPIRPVWDKILALIGPLPKDWSPATEPPPPGFIGTFSKTPPGLAPLWLYGIRPNGEMIWYRKDTSASAWQGPKPVSDGWTRYKDVLPAGGNRFYALDHDGKLFWHQHDGFNDGSARWSGGVRVGSGWTYRRIFSGGEGIVYAIRQDGKLIWFRHNGLTDGARSWLPEKEVGSEWDQYKDVFCTGQGNVYAVKWDGTLLLFQQINYQNGWKSWHPARVVGKGWNHFRQIIPVGDGVILAITNEGKLLWYRHLGKSAPNRIARLRETWEGPVEIGSGWQDFEKVLALIPLPSGGIVR